MNWFKRLCLFVFGLSGLLSLAALSLVWVGPWVSQARTLLLESQWYFLALEVLVCVSAVGLLACLLFSLFAPRNPRETIVATVDGGNITVTRNAIVSQTRHVVEADGTCVADSIRVRVRKRGNVRVFVRVTPRYPVDVVACGEELYARLSEGLAKVCGQSIKSIDVVFTDPQSTDDGPVVARIDEDHDFHANAEGHDVTVPMNSSRSDSDTYSEISVQPALGVGQGPAADEQLLPDVAVENPSDAEEGPVMAEPTYEAEEAEEV